MLNKNELRKEVATKMMLLRKQGFSNKEILEKTKDDLTIAGLSNKKPCRVSELILIYHPESRIRPYRRFKIKKKRVSEKNKSIKQIQESYTPSLSRTLMDDIKKVVNANLPGLNNEIKLKIIEAMLN